MTKDEAIKLALEALKVARDQIVDPTYAPIGWSVSRLDETLGIMREALAGQKISDCHATGVCAQSGLYVPQQAPADATKIAAHILTYLGFSQDESIHPGSDRRRDTVAMMIENAAPNIKENT